MEACQPLDALGYRDPIVRRMVELWLGVRRGRPLPRLSDFRLAQLEPYAGRMKIMRTAPLDAPSKWRYLFLGSRLNDNEAVDYTGYQVGDIPGIADDSRRKLYEHYLEAALGRAPGLHRIRLQIGAATHDYLRLLLPCGAADAEHLVMFAFLEEGATFVVNPQIIERLKRRAAIERTILRNLLQPPAGAVPTPRVKEASRRA